jgi:hypothetical protein
VLFRATDLTDLVTIASLVERARTAQQIAPQQRDAANERVDNLFHTLSTRAMAGGR